MRLLVIFCLALVIFTSLLTSHVLSNYELKCGDSVSASCSANSFFKDTKCNAVTRCVTEKTSCSSISEGVTCKEPPECYDASSKANAEWKCTETVSYRLIPGSNPPDFETIQGAYLEANVFCEASCTRIT